MLPARAVLLNLSLLLGSFSFNSIEAADSDIVSSVKLRISEQKCEEYNELYRQVIYSPLPFPYNETEYGDMSCPIPREALIVGGVDAEPFEFPAMVSLMYPSNDDDGLLVSNCGGVLISEQFVLSAAHCIGGNVGVPSKILLGEINIALESSSRRLEMRDISLIIIHKDYNRSSARHDIALLKLSQPLDLDLGPKVSIRPACLAQPSLHLPNRTKVDATGFGRTETYGDGSSTLKTVQLPIVPSEECDLYRKRLEMTIRFPSISKSTKGSWSFPLTILCAGGVEGEDTCNGDSGGPLFYSPNPIYPCHRVIVGITSYGSFCGTQTPAIYTKVSSYIDWIEQHVWPTTVITTTPPLREEIVEPRNIVLFTESSPSMVSNAPNSAIGLNISRLALFSWFSLGQFLRGFIKD